MDQYKVIFHLDEPSKGRADQVLTNITNLLNDLGDEHVQVELLANGGGVRALTRATSEQPGQEGQADADEPAKTIQALAKRGVRFVACQNSLNHLNIPREDLLDMVEVVPAGVSELVIKQSQGWAYIRP